MQVSADLSRAVDVRSQPFPSWNSVVPISARTALSASAGSAIDIVSVIDRDYLDESLAFVNSVDHPIRAASRTPKAFKLETERFSHPRRRICDMLDRL